MYTLLVIIHVLVSLILIFVVLLQSGKAGDLASAFGGAGSQAAFGARGAATVLTKATTICAILFMLTSLGLSIMFSRGTDSTVLDTLPAGEQPAVQQPSAEPAEPAVPSGTETQPTEAPPGEASDEGP